MVLLRRRCGITDLLTYFLVIATVAIILLVVTILYGTRSESPSVPPFVKEFLPAGRCLCQYSTTFTCDSCLDCAANQASINATEDAPEQWSFSFPRDASNYGLDDEQCQAAFPGLYEDIDRAVKERKGSHVTEKELSSFEMTKGMVRAMVFDGELYVIQTVLVDRTNRQKAIAALQAIHRAITSARHRDAIPNVEFVFGVEDLPAQPDKPIWVQARRAQDNKLWLMPDFGFWSWDVPSIGTVSELSDEAIERERVEPWDSKKDKLVWRGKSTMAPRLRRALLDAARGKPWSDVEQIRWSDSDYKEQFLGPIDQCNYKFIAHSEGRSYSGALKYRQLCRSVVVSHKLQWIQHHHYLMNAKGSNQNYVEVERDFTDLDDVMNDLLKHPDKAKRIANNNVKTFRERYLTPAAEACYWRSLIRGWKKVSFEPALYEGAKQGKVERSQKRGTRFETFAVLESDKQLTFPPDEEENPFGDH